jgi:DeoR family transcriptional regulator of aga operon
MNICQQSCHNSEENKLICSKSRQIFVNNIAFSRFCTLISIGASQASVRRDLIKLAQRGLVNRTHGSMELAGKMTYEPFRFDAAFPLREERFADEKRRIAIAAAEMVNPGDTIALSPGTTTTQVACSL